MQRNCFWLIISRHFGFNSPFSYSENFCPEVKLKSVILKLNSVYTNEI
ncbi:hypothetical protein LEP1GSC151_3370 [Leptospira interrogans serovar Grippotyphosa str. LT2186]|uniref:Uncharacterized protein n=2 Tax=Leptospira interrogans TaxID=173 RepID=M3I6F6_LEPIR|nr:hypothetical protein LEP1GSC151_3370 [Leptospira interrogans serovar Grippotyphosa str. LT2186]EMN30120.1 hypothetical protein LEP1GSC083_1774 [Leptospira interrogans serovar Pyrogenes str. L0374]EMN70042.1 hypothetical protein LEP1GSC100_3611 [Leptospira interrogans serovar Bataviae str. UI 08561]EMO95106.1 hypothetical protein LEP1GSC109_0605 [Leptospira interrogans str. UI 13372]